MSDYQEKSVLREKKSSFDEALAARRLELNQPNVDAFNEAVTPKEQPPEDIKVSFGEEPQVSVGDAEVVEEGDTRPVALDVPIGAAGGAIAAVNEFLQSTEEFADYLQTENIVPDLGQIQLFNEQGDMDLDFISTQEKVDRGLKGIQLPEPPRPETIAGSLAKGVTQFVTGFIPAARVTKVAQGATVASKVKRGIAAAAITDFTFFDPHEERLADFLQDNFEMRDPVTKFLSADPLDSSIEGRFKNVIEGLGVEVVTAGALTSMLKGYRAMRNIKKVPVDVAQKELDALTEQEGLSPIKLEDAPAEDIFKSEGKELVFEGDIDEDSLFDIKVGDGDKAFNVNLARIETTDDIQQIIVGTGRILDPKAVTKTEVDVTKATRGVQSNEQTQLLADDLGMTVEELLSRKKGQAFNAEQAVAARNLMVSSADNLTKMAEKMKGLDITDVDRLAFRKAMNLHVAIQKEVSGLTAEAGRALQSYNMKATGKQEQVKAINDLLMSGGGRGRVDEMAETLLNVVNNNPGNMKAINSKIDKLSRATTFDMVYEVWVNSILSGPITHAVNMSSNAIVAMNRIPEKALAAGIGKLSRGSDGAQFGETGAEIHGLLNGIVDGWRMARQSFATEGAIDPLSKIETRQFRSITSENFRHSMPGKVLGDKVLQDGGLAANLIDGFGTVMRFPGRMLGSEDAFFKGMNYRMELHAQAYRQATAEGLDGEAFATRMTDIIANPPDQIRVEAMDKAHINTFTDPNKIAKNISKVTQTLPITKFVVPFVNTPSNLIKFGFERTPLAPLFKTYKDAIEAGGVRADEARAKIAMGSSLMMTVGYFAAQGRITGSPPSSFAQRNIKKKVSPPNSIKIGDKWYSYRRTDPFGMLMGIAADMTIGMQEMDEGSAAELAGIITLAASNNILNKTWLTGISDFVETMSAPIPEGETSSRKVTNYFNNLGASFVPNFLRQTNVNVVDPYMREASDMASKMLAKIPGFSDELPLRRDVWGAPRMYNLIEESDTDDTTVWMAENDIGLSMPSRTVSNRGSATRLTDEEYSRFVELARVPAKRQLDKALPQLERSDKEVAEKIIKKILANNGKIARSKLFKEFPEIIERIEEEREL